MNFFKKVAETRCTGGFWDEESRGKKIRYFIFELESLIRARKINPKPWVFTTPTQSRGIPERIMILRNRLLQNPGRTLLNT